MIILCFFSGCSHCLHRHKWTHYSFESGNAFLFSLMCTSIVKFTYAHVCMDGYDFKHILKCCYSLLQFSVTEHFRSSESGRIQAVPGVFFFYDLSPIKVLFWSIFFDAAIRLASQFASSSVLSFIPYFPYMNGKSVFMPSMFNNTSCSDITATII